MDGNTITDNNIAITSQELAQIAHLQAQLDNMDTDDDMDVKDEEFSLKYEPDSEDGLIDTSNIVEVEIETESERISSDEILPDLKEDLKPVLTVPTTLKAIAPKPAIAPQKLPGKANLITAGGQQIVLIQSPGGTANAVSLNTGQPIKIVSQTGQAVTIPQLQAVRQQNVKSDRNVILRTTIPKSVTAQSNVMKTSSSFKRVVPPLQAKKVIVNSNQTNDPSAQLVKIITSTSGNSSILNSPSKTISLAQAQEMGLLTTSQIQQILPQTQGKQIILQSKTQPKAQLIKALPNPIKSPAKILPAPKLIQKQGQQKVIIRQGSQLKTVNTSGQQVLRIPANQLNATSGQIHQINIPGQGIQYVRLVSATSPNTSSVITTTAPTGATVRTVTSNSGTTVQLASQGAQSNKIQNVVPVALVNRISGNSATQNIVKVVPISTSAQTSTTNVRPVAPKPGTLSPSQRILVPTTMSSGQAKLSTGQTITTIHASALSQLHGIIPNNSNILMLPAQYVQLPSQANTTASKISTKQVTVANKAVAKNIQAQVLPKEEIIIPDDPSSEPIHNFIRSEPNGLRPRKPCNCTKSQCLKLYCDCFANGEFCYMCNCVNCFNNLENEEERQKAIKSCLERNPHAFRPKIGKGRDPGENAVRKHTKGCNCKRSGCLKNYCECYEAKIACSNNCKCVGCRNIEDSMEKKSLRPLAPLITLDYMSSTVNQFSIKSTNTGTKIPLPPLPHNRHRLIGNQSDVTNFRPMLGDASNKQAFTFMTSEVIEATCQCLLARADEAERNMLSDEQAEKQVLEEFGQCLIKIIQASARTENT